MIIEEIMEQEDDIREMITNSNYPIATSLSLSDNENLLLAIRGDIEIPFTVIYPDSMNRQSEIHLPISILNIDKNIAEFIIHHEIAHCILGHYKSKNNFTMIIKKTINLIRDFISVMKGNYQKIEAEADSYAIMASGINEEVYTTGFKNHLLREIHMADYIPRWLSNKMIASIESRILEVSTVAYEKKIFNT